MHKHLWLLLVLITLLPVPRIGAQPAQNESFTVQTIPIKGQTAYDMRVSPGGNIAAAYLGQSSAALLGFAPVEYPTEPTLLPIRLIDLATGEELGKLTGHTDYVSDLAFTPSGKELVSYHRNGDIFLWDVPSKKAIKRLTGIIGSPRLKFLLDGKTLVTNMGGSVATVGYFLLWDTATGQITKVWRPQIKSFGDLKLSKVPDSFDYSFSAFDVSPDGRLLVTATPNGEVDLWETGNFQKTMIQKKADKPGSFNIRSVVFSADGTTIVYYDSIGQKTHIWSVASHVERASLPIGGQFFALSPQGNTLAWATRKDVWFANLEESGSGTKVLEFPPSLLTPGPGIAFSADGKRIIVGGFKANGEGDNSGDNSLFVITLK